MVRLTRQDKRLVKTLNDNGPMERLELEWALGYPAFFGPSLDRLLELGEVLRCIVPHPVKRNTMIFWAKGDIRGEQKVEKSEEEDRQRQRQTDDTGESHP